MTSKYVVLASEGKEAIFVFPKEIDHDRFVECLMAIRFDTGGRDWDRKYMSAEPVAAGFVDHKPPVCYGRSETLNKDSRKQDTMLLWKSLGIES